MTVNQNSRAQLNEDLIAALETAQQRRDQAGRYWPTVLVLPTVILGVGGALIALATSLAPTGALTVWTAWITVVASATPLLLIRSAPYLKAAAADRKAHKLMQKLIDLDQTEGPQNRGDGEPA